MVAAGFLGLKRAGSLAAEQGYKSEVTAYGDLREDPHQIIDLPEGFEYTVVSRAGDPMDDGLRTPGLPDGMAAFRGSGTRTILVRNHELTPDQVFSSPFGLKNNLLKRLDDSRLYDPGFGPRPHLGGTTTLVYDPVGKRLERQFLSLAGTCRNCAGGPTPWGSWITCEETTDRANEDNQRDHGFNFEVPATEHPSLAEPVPLTAMGRFRHEAVAVDPRSGVVYQTEDVSDGLIYRFIPNRPGRLAMGGKLQALCIRGRPACDTRNWKETDDEDSKVKEEEGKETERCAESERGVGVMETLEVEWVDLDQVEAPENDLRLRGRDAGAAVFSRGEGMWHGNGRIYFACTDGGPIKKGQVFRYTPSPYEGTELERDYPGKLMLYIESTDPDLLEYADNLTVAPWGDLVLSEDGPGQQFIRGVTPEGKLYTIARNRINDSEFAGVCFAPNHPTLFVNIQRPGITLAITGPWNRSIGSGAEKDSSRSLR